MYEEFGDVAVEVEDVMEVDGKCHHLTTKCIQHVAKVSFGSQLDIVNLKSVRPDWQFKQELVGV